MAEVSGVSAIPDPTSVQDTTQTDPSSAQTVNTSAPAGAATIGQLGASFAPILKAMEWAIATNACNYSNQINQNIHDTLAEAEQDASS